MSNERKQYLYQRKQNIENILEILKSVSLPRLEWSSINTTINNEFFQMKQRDGKHKSAFEVLSMPNVTLHEMITIIQAIGRKRNDELLINFHVSEDVYDTAEASVKYANYLTRQESEMLQWRKHGFVKLPYDIEYTRDIFPSFSSEELEKLNKFRPVTLHDASQVMSMDTGYS